ncbi:hypothetical protein AB0K00_36445 [Dactylosporangium sp. NPDC049525]|uniref:hypothetical protein n=1 Tax=Dactylosporangium sp. NPDC049525 TaxID=3154730 RepID=UPI003424B0C3
MVTARLARLLLAIAARRWPADLREEMRLEWAAEVHALAARRRHWRMLRFAASLAATRPAVRPFSFATAAAKTAAVARLVLLMPLVTMAVALLGAVLGPLSVVGALVMVAVGHRFTIRRAPTLALIPVLTVPGCAMCVVLVRTVNADSYGGHTLATVLFFTGLAATLAFVARPAGHNRIRRAWVIGLAGVLLFLDAAVPTIMYGTIPSPDNPWHWEYSPMWLFAWLTDSSFGLPHPDFWEIFVLRDDILLEPPMFLVFAGFALGALIGARRPAAGAQDPLISSPSVTRG